ncbi:ATP-binding protein [Maribacter sp. 2307ULW6-5]|uniref:ATP-binding protein n=1 Tax=Maribacter sp. 2307ULW6-5 TaxID=3386275 RepID=UPI0039BC2605
MQIKLSFVKDPLVLPKRFEILERQVNEKGGEISKIVRKIDSASAHLESLLGKVSVGGTGQFQLFVGESGSGKTTFLRTLPNFFDKLYSRSFSKNDSFNDIIADIKSSSHLNGFKVFIIDEQDNPTINEKELREFFEEMRVLFRTNEGNVLIIWPITDFEAAKKIGDIAWTIGRESISPNSGPQYQFKGLDKSLYFDVADDTIRSLNNGESLDSFGITKEITDGLLKDCTTIGQFYSKIEDVAIQINEKTWKILEEKVKPKVWVLLPGDTSKELDRTVRSLTQGIDSKVDIDRMCAYLDDDSNKSAYLNDWRKRRVDAGFLFRFLDVRLFSVSPNLSLSAIRVYGSESTKSSLKKKSEAKKICHDLIRRSDFYLALLGKTDSSKRSVRATKEEAQAEYLRLQQNAKSGDKELNKAISKALEEVLKEDGFKGIKIKCEKQELRGTNLKPDIEIDLTSKEVVCLELTWRSSGQEVPNEIAAKQNTLGTGHIQKYILEKIMEFVKELEI